MLGELLLLLSIHDNQKSPHPRTALYTMREKSRTLGWCMVDRSALSGLGLP